MALFTAHTARAAAQLSVAARKAARERPPEPPPPVQVPLPTEAVDNFAARRLMRVREQLDRLDTELADCSLADSKRIKELTDAQLRLSEQERILAGRPLPGSMRPGTERPARRSARLEIGYPQPGVQVQPQVPDTPTGSVQPPST